MEPVPTAELTLRVQTLQKALAPAGIGLALIRQPADLFYYAGTLVDGFLAVAPQGQPSLLVRRPHHQDHSTPGPWPRVLYRDLKELPQILGHAGLEPRGAVALELDVIPAALVQPHTGAALSRTAHRRPVAFDPNPAHGQERL